MARWTLISAGIGAASYGAYVAWTWLRYGRVRRPAAGERDEHLNRFMPHYEVVERHHVHINAPAAVVLAAACEQDLQRSGVVWAVFRAREIVLGAAPSLGALPRGLLAQVLALGWGILTEVPGQEIVVGAVTKPWEANVTFRAVPPEAFAAFHEPDYVKIAWTLRAEPLGESETLFRTETRAVTTDAASRSRFRVYWAAFSPGIWIIRRLMLGPLKREAERRARTASGRHS